MRSRERIKLLGAEPATAMQGAVLLPLFLCVALQPGSYTDASSGISKADLALHPLATVAAGCPGACEHPIAVAALHLRGGGRSWIKKTIKGVRKKERQRKKRNIENTNLGQVRLEPGALPASVRKNLEMARRANEWIAAGSNQKVMPVIMPEDFIEERHGLEAPASDVPMALLGDSAPVIGTLPSAADDAGVLVKGEDTPSETGDRAIKREKKERRQLRREKDARLQARKASKLRLRGGGPEEDEKSSSLGDSPMSSSSVVSDDISDSGSDSGDKGEPGDAAGKTSVDQEAGQHVDKKADTPSLSSPEEGEEKSEDDSDTADDTTDSTDEVQEDGKEISDDGEDDSADEESEEQSSDSVKSEPGAFDEEYDNLLEEQRVPRGHRRLATQPRGNPCAPGIFFEVCAVSGRDVLVTHIASASHATVDTPLEIRLWASPGGASGKEEQAEEWNEVGHVMGCEVLPRTWHFETLSPGEYGILPLEVPQRVPAGQALGLCVQTNSSLGLVLRALRPIAGSGAPVCEDQGGKAKSKGAAAQPSKKAQADARAKTGKERLRVGDVTDGDGVVALRAGRAAPAPLGKASFAHDDTPEEAGLGYAFVGTVIYKIL